MNKLLEQVGRGKVKGVRAAKDETRTPLYTMFIGDLSGSMCMETRVIGESGEEKRIPKIDQLKYGFSMAYDSMGRFEAENTRFCVKYQFVELNTYCKALFPSYVSISDPQYSLKEAAFTADGVTNIEAAFNTAMQFITKKHAENCNRAINVIMISDGIPTNVNGYPLSEKEWKTAVDKLNAYLEKNDFARSVVFYFIAVGDEAEPFGRYFAGDERFYKVEDCENLGDKLDFVTRQTLADSTTISGNPIGYGEDDDPLDDDEPDILDDEDDAPTVTATTTVTNTTVTTDAYDTPNLVQTDAKKSGDGEGDGDDGDGDLDALLDI